jgi:hypothetical protein
MKPFEQFLHEFAMRVLRGELDLAVVQEKFIKGGLWNPPPCEGCDDLYEFQNRDRSIGAPEHHPLNPPKLD